MSEMAEESTAFLRWFMKIGMAMAARIPMMIMTTRSSIRVKPWSFCSMDLRIRAIIAHPFICSVSAGGPAVCGGTGRSSGEERVALRTDFGDRGFHPVDRIGHLLLNEVEDGKDRHVQGDDHEAHDAAQHRDHQRLDDGRQSVGGRLDLLVVELGDLLQHLVQGA